MVEPMPVARSVCIGRRAGTKAEPPESAQEACKEKEAKSKFLCRGDGQRDRNIQILERYEAPCRRAQREATARGLRNL